MKATIVESIMGVLGFDENNVLIDYALFPKDSRKIAENLSRIEIGEIVDELTELIEKLKTKGYNSFVFENMNTAKNAQEKLKIVVEVAHPSPAGELLRGNLESFAVQAGFVEEADEFRNWTHLVLMDLTKMRVRKAAEKRDSLVSQAIQAIDDLDKTANLFMSRIREWYGLHFPELDRLVEKHETYAHLIVDLGQRENLTANNLEKEGLPNTKAQQIAELAEKSMGTDVEENDLVQIQTFCRGTLQLYDARQSLEGYVDSLMEDVAPNIKALVSSLLGARLIALSGRLANLATMPASTIQVLGAEKALFRSLKSGSRPPKHGIIFQHSLIHEAKRWQRGKIARALAGKLAIAARIDAYSGKYRGDQLKADLERRIKEIQEKYGKPPPAKQVLQPQQVKKPFGRRMKRGRRR